VASKRQRRYRDRRRSGRAPLTEAELERAEARRQAEAARPKRERPVASAAATRDARGRPIRVPSWTRPLKLAPIFLVFWFVLVRYVTRPSGMTTQGAALQALLLTAVLVPAMYLSDRMAYRIAMRRKAKGDDAPAAGKRS
jgi:hypothetical protein